MGELGEALVRECAWFAATAVDPTAAWPVTEGFRTATPCRIRR
jgi:hypothetical protein